MGLTIHYELSLPAGTPDADVFALLTKLRQEALALPFAAVSDLVELTEQRLADAWPIEGLVVLELEEVVGMHARFMRDELYRQSIGGDGEYGSVEAPDYLPTTVVGFAVAPGDGSEPAAFALMKIGAPANSSHWAWQCFCKTQYASAHGDEHFLKCHRSVIALLDAAQRLGIECVVHDEGGFYEARNDSQLLASVGTMNRLIARFAGHLSDAYEKAGGDSRQVQAEIFRHPDFERLESD